MYHDACFLKFVITFVIVQYSIKKCKFVTIISHYLGVVNRLFKEITKQANSTLIVTLIYASCLFMKKN